ncbi:MAG: hypothetical protein HKO66_10490 [Saprospiraceae bacterium]|nr:hypothetical protein [Saprospiraceae bacterium]
MKIKHLQYIILCLLVLNACNDSDQMVYDCPDLELNIGDECSFEAPDRQDAITGIIDENCECVLTHDSYDCPELQQNIGDTCRDENDNIGIVSNECICLITDVAQYDCPDLEYNIGDVCRYQDDTGAWYDGVINNNCNCVANDVAYDCPDIQQNIGDGCRYQDDTGAWYDGVVNDDCECTS